MGDKRNDGGPAFPCLKEIRDSVGTDAEWVWVNNGMTLREYYAGIAFGVLVAAHADQKIDQLSKLVIADESISYADYLIARLEGS